MSKIKFPNGFESWYPTVAATIIFITEHRESNGEVKDMTDLNIYDTAMDWALEFEEKFKGQDWDGPLQWDEELPKFLNQKNRS